MKKLIAKEILILFSTAAAFCLILFLAWVFEPKRKPFIVKPSEWVTQNGQQTKELQLKQKEYFDNEKMIDNYETTFVIIEIILISLVYPLRGLYYLIKWCINTLKQ